jgi:hypothetical protein
VPHLELVPLDPGAFQGFNAEIAPKQVVDRMITCSGLEHEFYFSIYWE